MNKNYSLKTAVPDLLGQSFTSTRELRCQTPWCDDLRGMHSYNVLANTWSERMDRQTDEQPKNASEAKCFTLKA